MTVPEIIAIPVFVYLLLAGITSFVTVSNWRNERVIYDAARAIGRNPDRKDTTRAARAVLLSPVWPALLAYIVAILIAGVTREARATTRALWHDAFPPKKETR